MGECTMDAANTGTGGLDSGFATVMEVPKHPVYFETISYPALNTDGIYSAEVPKVAKSVSSMSPTTASKIPIMVEITMNVLLVKNRPS